MTDLDVKAHLAALVTGEPTHGLDAVAAIRTGRRVRRRRRVLAAGLIVAVVAAATWATLHVGSRTPEPSGPGPHPTPTHTQAVLLPRFCGPWAAQCPHGPGTVQYVSDDPHMSHPIAHLSVQVMLPDGWRISGSTPIGFTADDGSGATAQHGVAVLWVSAAAGHPQPPPDARALDVARRIARLAGAAPGSERQVGIDGRTGWQVQAPQRQSGHGSAACLDLRQGLPPVSGNAVPQRCDLLFYLWSPGPVGLSPDVTTLVTLLDVPDIPAPGDNHVIAIVRWGTDQKSTPEQEAVLASLHLSPYLVPASCKGAADPCT